MAALAEVILNLVEFIIDRIIMNFTLNIKSVLKIKITKNYYRNTNTSSFQLKASTTELM